MLIKKLCVKGRGEGKTATLIKHALFAEDNNVKNIFYVGSDVGYMSFCDSYERSTGSKCKIRKLKHKSDVDVCGTMRVYLTDELLTELPNIDARMLNELGGVWYITLSKEYIED